MSPTLATLWWLAAGVAVAAELATGTFYLLMVALGLVGGAIAAHLGFGSSVQIIVAASIGVGATLASHWRRSSGPPAPPVRENRDVNLDIGAHVTVPAWRTDRTARVQYRGAAWTARLVPNAMALPGEFTVAAVEGNWLVLKPV